MFCIAWRTFSPTKKQNSGCRTRRATPSFRSSGDARDTFAVRRAMTGSGDSNRPRDHDHLPEIRAGLRTAIDGVARRLLGDPVRSGRNPRTLSFGTRSGSLHVEVRGPKQGLWYDHAESVGGDALALI